MRFFDTCVIVVVVILSHTRVDHNVNFCPGMLLTIEINLEAEAILKLKQIKLSISRTKLVINNF